MSANVNGLGSSGHVGGSTPGLGRLRENYKITDLDEELRRLSSSFHDRFLEDPHQVEQLKRGQRNSGGVWVTAKVIQAIPGLHWYRIQVSGGPTMPACMMSDGNTIPVGPRTTSTIGPNNNVLVFIPGGLALAYIAFVIPAMSSESWSSLGDYVQQAGRTGYKIDRAHYKPIALYNNGGVQDFSSGRPVDSTVFEWGKLAETGVGIHVDSFQTFMRVNEACGIWFNHWDSYCRHAAMQYDFQSFVKQTMLRQDEGENLYIDGNIIYPWEATGCYTSGTNFTEKPDPKEVQYDGVKADVDLKPGDADIQSFMRGVDYRGYLGQGYQRFIASPGDQSGVRKFSDENEDRGLFHEHVSIDGGYAVTTAKSYSVVKRIFTPTPKLKCLPEDGKNGDDAKEDNYKFSSTYGSGDPHKPGDIQPEAAAKNKHVLKVAGVMDLLAHALNWKSLHPFHYHENDYELPEESELKSSISAFETLDFDTLVNSEYMNYPKSDKIKIDHRFGDVEYFQRTAFFVITDDGSIVLGDGYGSTIEMSGGQIRLSAPGDIVNITGKRHVVLGHEAIVRTKNAVDISVTEGDFRLKAEKNLQILGGNGGKGGVLIESKSDGLSHQYKDLYGSDVTSSGVVILAKQSQVAMLGGEVYLRTGGPNMKAGPIILDAAKGKNPILAYSSSVNMFNTDGVNIWHGESNDLTTMVNSHQFSRNAVKLAGKVTVQKDLSVVEGSVYVSGMIGARGNIITEKQLSQKSSQFVGPHEGKVSFENVIKPLAEQRTAHVQAGEPQFKNRFADTYDAENALASDTITDIIGFSFRDPPGDKNQYGTRQFNLVETRWQHMLRTSQANGGKEWVERPVINQSQESYPWPGKQKWQDEPTLLSYDTHVLFNPNDQTFKDRGEAYETAKLAGWKSDLKPNSSFKLIS